MGRLARISSLCWCNLSRIARELTCDPVCVRRDLLRLGGTLPGHNRKSPDGGQEAIRQQMSQTLPIRV
ncbi:Ephrin type-B receptor 3 [Takifugu flavidus]|uniref:Ephrin type-B receptor 3 n=1 Tax=Takifugu flavidus TaxID=433684 RepID=A0A5C6P3Z3_9TELE|nr:Ephrin type-B receptor 3 [Takifugu flavidus]